MQGVVIEETDEFFVYEFLINFGNKMNKEVTVKVSSKFTSNMIYSRDLGERSLFSSITFLFV